jgi:hypothetical protein
VGGVITGTSTSVTGTTTAASVVGGVMTSSSVSVTGAVTGASLVGTLTTAAQTNITSVGTLTSLSVTGNITGGNVSGTTGAFTTVTGNGQALTSLSASNINTGTLSAANGGTGITSLGAGIATFLGTPTSANLAAAVTDETGSGLLVFGTTPVLTGVRVTLSALGTLTTGTTTIDLATAQVFTATITAANTITIAFSNAPAAGQSQVVLLRLTNAGGGTIVWPAATKFTGGTAPTLTASGVDVLGVYYDVTTTTYMVFVIGLNVKVP